MMMIPTLRVVTLGVLLITVTSGEIITDRTYFTFATDKVTRPKAGVIEATFKRHVGSLPTVLRNSKLQLKPVRQTAQGLAGQVSLESPYLGSTGYGWLTAVSIWGEYSGIIHVKFNRPRVYVYLYIRGTPNNGFIGNGKAKHEFVRPAGVRMIKSKLSVSAGVKALQNALNSNANGPRLIATIDHSLAAKQVGKVLSPNTVVVFGRPQIGAPLWRQTPEIGIELPIEMHVAETPLGYVYVSYNSAAYFGRRFNIPNLSLPLFRFARVASGIADLAAESPNFDVSRARSLSGIRVEMKQGTTAAQSYGRLITALQNAPKPLGIAFKIEHDKSAIKAGIAVNAENKVVVFGNPALGTRLMQRSFTAGLDLPAKMGVWDIMKGANKSFVGYVDIEWIVRRHDVAEEQTMLAAALRRFQQIALGS